MNGPNPDGATRILPYGEAAVAEAARAIVAGDCVAVPTETVYGLAADAGDSRAVAGIYAAKGRPDFNPLIVHVASRAAAQAVAHFDAAALALAEAFWPGPLTLVLPRAPDSPVSSLATAGLATVAVRVPAHRAMRALLAASGRPLAAPSANASGGISTTRAAHVAASLGNRVKLILDDGPTPAGLESTIIGLGERPRLLRPGPVPAEEIAAVLGITLTTGVGGIEAPGQLASHYAPGKPLRLDASEASEGEVLIGFGDVVGDLQLSAAGDPVEAAARLFDLLHEADRAPQPNIAVAPIPQAGIGAAINDRLRRAAAPRD